VLTAGASKRDYVFGNMRRAFNVQQGETLYLTPEQRVHVW